MPVLRGHSSVVKGWGRSPVCLLFLCARCLAGSWDERGERRHELWRAFPQAAQEHGSKCIQGAVTGGGTRQMAWQQQQQQQQRERESAAAAAVLGHEELHAREGKGWRWEEAEAWSWSWATEARSWQHRLAMKRGGGRQGGRNERGGVVSTFSKGCARCILGIGQVVWKCLYVW